MIDRAHRHTARIVSNLVASPSSRLAGTAGPPKGRISRGKTACHSQLQAASLPERLATPRQASPTDSTAIAGCDDAALRGVGLSGQKVSYLRDLCARIADGRLRLDELDELPDEEVIERLTAVRGFGRWTAA